MSRENDETKRRERGRRVKDPPIANLARTMSVYTLSERYISINAAHQDGTVPPKGTTTTFHFTFCYVRFALFFYRLGTKRRSRYKLCTLLFPLLFATFCREKKREGEEETISVRVLFGARRIRTDARACVQCFAVPAVVSPAQRRRSACKVEREEVSDEGPSGRRLECEAFECEGGRERAQRQTRQHNLWAEISGALWR